MYEKQRIYFCLAPLCSRLEQSHDQRDLYAHEGLYPSADAVPGLQHRQ